MRSGPSSLRRAAYNMRPETHHRLRLWSKKPRQYCLSLLHELHASRRILDMREISRLAGCPSSMYRGRGKRFYSRFMEHFDATGSTLRDYPPPPPFSATILNARVRGLRYFVTMSRESWKAIRSDAAVYAAYLDGSARRLTTWLQLTHLLATAHLIGHDRDFPDLLGYLATGAGDKILEGQSYFYKTAL